MSQTAFRKLQLNGGKVMGEAPTRLLLPPSEQVYVDAQIDDYGAGANGKRLLRSRRNYPWRPGTNLRLNARFSHRTGELVGTAGFGFWNAPFGDPTVRWPALPQAAWFFYASRPSNLPLAEEGPGRGWFAATLDASRASAIMMAPLAPVIVILDQVDSLRRRFWPAVRRGLRISYAQIDADIREWHDYALRWRKEGCVFSIDGGTALETHYSPRGPLGFVCWLDNQYLVLTNRGRLGWGVLPVPTEQWLEVDELEVGVK